MGSEWLCSVVTGGLRYILTCLRRRKGFRVHFNQVLEYTFQKLSSMQREKRRMKRQGKGQTTMMVRQDTGVRGSLWKRVRMKSTAIPKCPVAGLTAKGEER